MLKGVMIVAAAASMILFTAMAAQAEADSPVPLIVLPGEPHPIPLLSQYWGNNDDPWKRMEEDRQYREKQEQERQEQQKRYDQQQRDYESQQRQWKMDQMERDMRYGNPSSSQLEQYKRDMDDLDFKRKMGGAGRTYDPTPNYQETSERYKYDQLQQQIDTKHREAQQTEEANRNRTTPSYDYDPLPWSSTSSSANRKPDAQTDTTVGDVAVVTLTVKDLGSFTFRHAVVVTDTNSTILGDIAKQVNATAQLASQGISAKLRLDGSLQILVPESFLSRVSMTMSAEKKQPASTPSTTPPAQQPKAQEQQPATSTPSTSTTNSQSSDSKEKVESKTTSDDQKNTKKAKKQKRNLAKKVFGGIGKIFRRHSDE